MRFKTAIIDPPWPYQKASKSVKLTGYVSQDGNSQYSTMSIKDLAALPVGEVVEQYIFVWTVGPFLRESLSLIEHWGFEYKTQLCWYKNTGFGVGYWFRGDHELILVGKTKAAPSVRTNERSLFQSKRTRHSDKPELLHKMVEKHFPGPYLELFGRRTRSGWTVLGNEAPGDGKDIQTSLRDVIEVGNNELDGLLSQRPLAPGSESISADCR